MRLSGLANVWRKPKLKSARARACVQRQYVGAQIEVRKQPEMEEKEE